MFVREMLINDLKWFFLWVPFPTHQYTLQFEKQTFNVSNKIL